MATDRISILLLVRSLELGGAERQLVELARGLKRRGQRVAVAVFYNRGPLGAELDRAGVPIIDLRKTGRWEVFGFLVRVRRAVHEFQPDVLYSFLGGANLVAAAVRPFMPGLRMVWSIRASDMDLTKYDGLQRLASVVERRLARSADLIIANSHAGRAYAVAKGFPEETTEVVPNGIDTARFRPDRALRKDQRARWNIVDGQIVVGVLARLDPMKGHEVLMRAAAEVMAKRSEILFLCVGDGPEAPRLKRLAVDLGVKDQVRFPGPTQNPVAALNAFDLCCSPSVFGEGFSNAIAEAMACGVPCVVTDVGDSARIIGATGTVVPRADVAGLAKGILAGTETLGPERSRQARTRIIEQFSVDAMVDATLILLQRTVHRAA